MAGTVTVACCLPNGICLDGKQTNGLPRRVEIRGTATEANDDPRARRRGFDGELIRTVRQPPLLIGKYALTPNVDEEFWNAWLATHQWMDIVKKRFIYATPKPADAQAIALELKDAKTGLEPIDASQPVHIDRGTVTSGA